MLEICRPTILGDRPIAGYCYLEIATKKTLFCKYPRENKNIFENILGCGSGAKVLYIPEKKPELVNLMLVSL